MQSTFNYERTRPEILTLLQESITIDLKSGQNRDYNEFCQHMVNENYHIKQLLIFLMNTRITICRKILRYSSVLLRGTIIGVGDFGLLQLMPLVLLYFFHLYYLVMLAKS